jgi:hypothetical protein
MMGLHPRAWARWVLLASSALGCNAEESRQEGAIAVSAASSVPLPAPGADERRPVPTLFQTNTPYGYALTLDSKLDLPGDAKSVEIRLVTDLGVRREPNVQDTERLSLLFGNPKIQGVGDSAGADFSGLELELAGPFEVELQRGRVEALHSRTGLSAFAVNIQRTIAAALQLATDGDQVGANWTAQERDATGEYLVEYSVLPAESGAAEVVRRKLRYAATVGSQANAPGAFALAGAPLLPQVEKGQSRLVLRDGALLSVEHEEELRLEALGGAPVLSTTRLTLKRLEQGAPAAPDVRQPLQRLGAMEAYAPPTDGAANALLDKARIGDWTFEAALAELESVQASTKAPPSTGFSDEQAEQRQALSGRAARAFVATEALIRTEANVVGRVREAIAKGSLASSSLLDALGSSNSPAAQHALLDVVADKKLPRDVRGRAVTALGRAETPPPVVVEKLIELLKDDDLWVRAAYSLGILGRKARQRGQTPLSDQATEALVARLASAQSVEHRVHALRSIANSGDAAALSAVKPLLGVEEPTLRLAAVQAMSLMQDPEVDALLAARFGVEERANVRKVITDTLEMRPPSEKARDAVFAFATSQKDASARASAIKLLGRWRFHFPSLDAALRKLEQEDTEEKVREAAKQALAGPAGAQR